MSVADSVTFFAVANEALPSSSSTVSPTAAPEPPRPTRIVVAPAASVALRYWSESFVVTASMGAFGADGAVGSYVNVRTVLPESLPATSVCRTYTVLTPSVAWKVLLQPETPLAEYVTTAPFSKPLSASVPTFVILSPKMPVSLESATVGAEAVRSSVKVITAAAETFSATSV